MSKRGLGKKPANLSSFIPTTHWINFFLYIISQARYMVNDRQVDEVSRQPLAPGGSLEGAEERGKRRTGVQEEREHGLGSR